MFGKIQWFPKEHIASFPLVQDGSILSGKIFFPFPI